MANTATAVNEEFNGFREAEASEKPTLLCVGTVGEVEDAHISKSEDYVVQPIKIEALDAGRNQTLYLLYRPEWLTRSFNPASMKDEHPGPFFVYGKNIATKDGYSNLRGLAGSQEAFVSLAKQLIGITANDEGPNMEAVTKVLRDFFAANVDAEGNSRKIGYELRQQQTKTDEVDEDGKAIYLRENRYEVKSYFDVTEKGLATAKRRAERSNGKVKFTFAS